MWKVVSFTNVSMPLIPFKNGYILVILENTNKQRTIAQVKSEYKNSIHIGTQGTITTIEYLRKKIQMFSPKVTTKKKIRTKVALITGSSRGIGKAIALELAKRGIDIIINSKSSVKEGKDVVLEIKKLGRKAYYLQADVSDVKQIDTMMRAIKSKSKCVDILVNNAGLMLNKRLENMTKEQWDIVLKTNLDSVFLCSKAVIPLMKDAGFGRIVSMTSFVGQMGYIGQTNYTAAKGGIISFTKSLAQELAGDNITVNAVAPGCIETDMMLAVGNASLEQLISQIPMGRLGKPEEVASLVGYLVSDEARYITGQIINVNGGLYM